MQRNVFLGIEEKNSGGSKLIDRQCFIVFHFVSLMPKFENKGCIS